MLVLSTIAYFSWRPSVINPEAPIFSWLFIVVEIVGVIWGVFFVSMTLRQSHRQMKPAPPGLSVDVFITSFNEPEALVRCTLTAALAIRYPHCTWLLDDSARPEMHALAKELGCNYLARHVNTDAKAGNLNHGLANSQGDFVVVLDADHIALPEFLDNTLGHFVDSRVAFIQTPQEFYNFNSFEHMGADRVTDSWSEHSLFHRVIQRQRDLGNAAMFSGTGAILRRKALDEIGGFAAGTVTEDMHTSVRLHARGWHSVFHAQSLTGGLATSDARSFWRQRLRWGQGAMQVFVQERLLTREGLSRNQRIAYVSHVIGNLAGWKSMALAFLPSLALQTGISPIQADIATYLSIVGAYFTINVLVYEELARGHGRFFRSEVHNLARCIPSILVIFSAWRRNMPFRVTPKTPQRNKDSHVVFLPWIVITAAICGLITAWWRVATGASSWSGVAIMSVWAAYVIWNAAGVILINRRCRKHTGIEPLFPTDLFLTLEFDDNAARTPYHNNAIGIATDRITLRSDPILDCAHEQLIAATFSINQRLWHLRGKIQEAPEGCVEIKWSFESKQQAAEYALEVISRRLYFLQSFGRLDHETRWSSLTTAMAHRFGVKQVNSYPKQTS
ncbi:MAG: glycosyltransferase [Burkholderiales bacterium]